MKPELKKLCGNLRGFSLKDKKLSRKGFRGVSRQVLSAFRKRIRWVYPGGLSFSIFLSRGLGFSRPSSSLFWARTVLRSPVGDMRPLPGLPRGAEDAPRVPRISPEAGLLSLPSHFDFAKCTPAFLTERLNCEKRRKNFNSSSAFYFFTLKGGIRPTSAPAAQ